MSHDHQRRSGEYRIEPDLALKLDDRWIMRIPVQRRNPPSGDEPKEHDHQCGPSKRPRESSARRGPAFRDQQPDACAS